MRRKSYYIVLVTCCLIFVFLPNIKLNAQIYDLKISQEGFTLDSKQFKGYSTIFNLKYATLKKEWWRYIKKLAVLENHKTYYVISFPPDKSNSNTPIILISTIEDNDEKGTLKTALFDQKMNNEYLSYAKNILIDFKVSFFTKDIQEKIVASEKKAIKTSKSIDINDKKIAVYKYKKKKGKANSEALSITINQLKVTQDSLRLQLISIQETVNEKRLLLRKIK